MNKINNMKSASRINLENKAAFVFEIALYTFIGFCFYALIHVAK